MIAKGADVDAKDDDGRTSLYFARTKDLAEMLIIKGADVNATDKDGRTPMANAIAMKLDKVAEVLRQHGGK